MAITILQQPGNLNFAGDPILVKAQTSKTGVTFLQISVTITVTASEDPYTEYTEEYNYPVASDRTATVNVAESVRSVLDRYNRQTVSGTTLTQNLSKASFSLSVKERWMEGVQELEGDPHNIGPYSAIAGSLTEFERMTASNLDTESIIGSGKPLSRKPDGERVARGADIYLPAVSTGSSSLSAALTQGGGTVTTGTKTTDGAGVPGSIRIGTSGASDGAAQLSCQGKTSGKYIVSPTAGMRHFIFLNGFGLAESVMAECRESLSYEVTSEQFTVGRDIGFRPNTEVRSFSNGPSGLLAMSSGFVSREWAEWWIQEFITTRQAWMLEDGRYIPVAIVPEEDNMVFDRAKPGLMAVKFTVRYSFKGSTLNSFFS